MNRRPLDMLIVAGGVIAGAVASTLAGHLPPVAPAGAPATGISAARALPDLRFITAAPHPTGTPDHDRLRDYLVDRLRALDCQDVHVQSAVGFVTLNEPLAATVANVVCRKPGTHPGRAILLTAHYDAVPHGPGAGDDGAAVAALLETLRALDAGPPLDRDVIVLFTDAEEAGLLGAEAFVDLHPWAKDVALVLNFDDRGDQGPVYMFQTSPGNAPLIQALSSVHDANTNSLTGEVYRHLPSDTDLSIWLHSRFPVGALNFAAVGGYPHYHTPIDDLPSLDLRIVQQMGDDALGVVRQVGGASLSGLRTHDDIYWTMPLVGIVRYPAALALPVAVATALLVVAFLLVEAKRQKARPQAMLRSLGAMAGTIILAIATVSIGWKLATALHPAYADILQHEPYNGSAYLAAAAALVVTIALIARRLAGSVTLLEAVAPALVLWTILLLAVAAVLPGGSYLFQWPLVAVLLAVAIAGRCANPIVATLVLAVAIVAVLVPWWSLIGALETALTVQMLSFCAALVALLACLLWPQLGAWTAWPGIAAVFLVAAGAIVVAETHAGFTATRKHPDSLAWFVNADGDSARWVSADRAPDRWTRRWLGPNPARVAFPGDPFAAGRGWLASPWQAVVRHDAAIALDVTQDSTGRRVHLLIPRSGSGEIVTITTAPGASMSRVVINGRSLAAGDGSRYSADYRVAANGTVILYDGLPPEGLDLRFSTPTRLRLRVETAVDGFPVPLPPRPADLMSKPFIATDMTITEHTLQVP